MMSRRNVRFASSTVAVVIVAGIIAAPISAQPGEKNPGTKPMYETIGMGGAGGIFEPGASPVDPQFLLCTSDMGGCYRSDDGGKSWRMIHYKQISSAQGCKPCFHPKNVNIVVWKDRITYDKGRTWQPLAKGNPPWGNAVTHVALSGGEVPAVYVGNEAGLWGSLDGCKSWKSMVKGACGGITILPDGNAYAGVDGALYTWVPGKSEPTRVKSEDVTEKIKAVAAGGPVGSHTIHLVVEGGVYTSNDSGKTWRMSFRREGIADVVMSVNQAAVAYARDAHEVFVTRDGGRTWNGTFKNNPNLEHGWIQTEFSWGFAFLRTLNVCPSNPDIVMVTTPGDIYISRDAGGSWRQAIDKRVGDAPDGRPGGRYGRYMATGLHVTGSWDYYFDPNDPNRHYIAHCDLGFARSVDGGETWSCAAVGSPWTNTFYGVVFDPFQKGKMYAACSNKHDIPHWTNCDANYLPGGVCVSEDFAANWKPISAGLPEKPCTGIALDPRSKPGKVTLYVSMYGSGVYKSTDGGRTWAEKPGVGRPGNYHVYQIICHEKTGDIYVNVTANRKGGEFSVPGGLWKSSDGGETWKELTADIKLYWANGFAVHPENPNIIYIAAGGAGRGQGGLYKTTDGGKSWKHILQAKDMNVGFTQGMFVVLHPDDPNVLYYGGGDGLYLSSDAGTTWRLIEEIPFRDIHRVRIDPRNKDTMYVTTLGGSVIRGPVVKK